MSGKCSAYILHTLGVRTYKELYPQCGAFSRDMMGEIVVIIKAENKYTVVVLRVYGPVNSYGHIEPLTLFQGRLRHIKQLTST